jgi:multicomponent Na+:H+ antiporter subunit E
MSGFGFRRLVSVVALTAVWCALWGEVSLANVLSGLAVSSLATVRGLGSRARGGIRLRPLAVFAGFVAFDLLRSTFSVAREILTPTDNTMEVVVAVTTPRDARSHLLLLVVAVTVTPGTAVVDVDADNGNLYLHLLHGDRVDEVVAHVQRLAALACEALPVGDALETVEGGGR